MISIKCWNVQQTHTKGLFFKVNGEVYLRGQHQGIRRRQTPPTYGTIASNVDIDDNIDSVLGKYSICFVAT